MSKTDQDKPIVVFGVLSDIQYADIPDRAHGPTRHRFYRNSLNLMREAINEWCKQGGDKLAFVLQLGDIVDASCALVESPGVALKRVLAEYKTSFNAARTPAVPLLHVWGNHDVHTFGRDHLVGSFMNTARVARQNLTANANYYRRDITDNLTLICLDFYKFSILGYSTDECFEADYHLRKFKPDKKLDPSLKTHENENARFQGYNGGLGDEQTKWLDENLAECHANARRVIVCGHTPLHRKTSIPTAIAWDAPQVIELLRKYPGTVIAYLAGHYHPGGYHVDKAGIHYVTIRAILETKPGDNSFATVFVHANRLVFKGSGSSISSFEVNL